MLREVSISGMFVLTRKIIVKKSFSRITSSTQKLETVNILRTFCSKINREIGKKDVSSKIIVQTYNPKTTETGWYDWWESKGYFKPKNDENIFTILLPPPNITGTLHLGHALTITIQDVFLRWMRMKGKNVLWIPGFDHAGIATQVAVEKYLINLLNLTKYDLGKEEFIKKIFEWRSEKENIIIQQMKQIGASVDWDRKYFTLDAANCEAVNKAFIHLYEKGLIHRCKRLVSWSCFLKSAISDIEIEWKEIDQPSRLYIPGYRKPIEYGYLYKFAYKICDDYEGDEIVVATTRPETILGDTAVAVHPDDSRYFHLKNKFVWHPFRKCKIPIIFDKDVKADFGTGAVKITPAHSQQDFEISERHNLEVIDVIDESGLIKKLDCYSKFGGMKRLDAREKMLHELQNLNLYRGKQKHLTFVPICSRSGDIIEYISKPQWFLKCDGMMKKIQDAFIDDDIKIDPHYCKDILLDWFKHGKDWNLSRHLWWGHQIPMYECKTEKESEWIPATSLEEAKRIAQMRFQSDPSQINIIQDPDVLDTWFSSGILPFSISGWPNELKHSTYPLGIMETGRDIVFFWVARMLMLGLEIIGELPFRKIVLHGLMCDAYGRKMSKSLGNVVLPENVIHGATPEAMKAQAERNFLIGILNKGELKRCIDGQKKMFPAGIPECGADALRLTLCNDKIKCDSINFNVDLCRANKHFCNKIWQATIFLLKSTQNVSDFSVKIPETGLSFFDKWILSSLSTTVNLTEENLKNFQFHHCIEAIRNFILKQFCDLYLESTKLVLTGGSTEEDRRAISILFNCLETSFRLLTPFTPFLTEELYHCLPKLNDFIPSESITITQYPDPNYWAQFYDPGVENVMSKFLKILYALRSMRSMYRLSKQNLKVFISCSVEFEELFCDELTNFLKKHASVGHIDRVKGEISDKNVIVQEIGDCKIHLYHEHDRDTLREIFASILLKESNLKEQLQKLNSTISQPNYEEKTPIEMKKKNSLTLSNLIAELKKIEELKIVIERAH